MDKILTFVIAFVTAIVISLGGVALAPESTTTVVKDKLGALAGPDIPYPYISVGGQKMWFAHPTAFNAATTTILSIQSPAATSTLVTSVCDFDTSSTSASTITWAKSTTPNGSSTPLASASISANAQANLALPATTTAAGMANMTFAPNTYLNVTMAGGLGTFSPTGGCGGFWLEN